MSKLQNFGIKNGYKARLDNAYYDDFTGDTIWQPDVYTALIKLAKRCGVETIIDIGSGNGEKLIPYKEDFKFIFVDFGANLDVIKKNIGVNNNKFIDQDFEKGFPKFSKKILKNSLVVCSDVIEHIRNPEILAKSLTEFSKDAPFVLISTPDRLRTRGASHFGPPDNLTHVREWSMEELDTYFRSLGMNLISGITRSNDYEHARRTIAIVAGEYIEDLLSTPKVKAEILASYPRDVTDYAKDYYWSEEAVLVGRKDRFDTKLPKGYWLGGPSWDIKIGSVVADAKAKGYSYIDAQKIALVGAHSKNWPVAGVVRQGHGMMGVLEGVYRLRINDISDTGNKGKTYPIQLTLFRQTNHPVAFIKKTLTQNSQLVDVGHLRDEYLLESFVGWDILKG